MNDEVRSAGLGCSLSQISTRGSNGACQDFKSLLRETLKEFHFSSAWRRSSSFAVIILGVATEEEVTCSGNIAPPSAGRLGVGGGGDGNRMVIYGDIILPCRTFKSRIRSNKFPSSFCKSSSCPSGCWEQQSISGLRSTSSTPCNTAPP